MSIFFLICFILSLYFIIFSPSSWENYRVGDRIRKAKIF
nr:MAG TPA: hypothetical protein [Caudoviricetes sp.]